MDRLSLTEYLTRDRETEGSLTERGRKKTKVVATLGPSTDDPEILDQLYHAGMNVARLNMSHGEREDHDNRLRALRKMSNELDRPVAALVDLQGPKIRLGTFASKTPVVWSVDQQVVISTDPALRTGGEPSRVGTTYPGLADDLDPGDTVLVDDGKIRLRVLAIEGHDIRLQVLIGGPVSANKGINLPDTAVSAASLTDKDKDDLAWAIHNDIDYIALSFVSSARDIRNLRRRIREAGRDIPIIAKIERESAVRNMEEIICEADGIMVARGDLGIELSTERLPVVQKHLIHRANAHGKLVITATQMLESMISIPVPTRAETSDVANAIFDGTDAIMLSGETAIGRYPVEAVREMLRISVEAEASRYLPPPALDTTLQNTDKLTLAITSAAAHLAEAIDARGVMIFSHGIEKARLLSESRYSGKAMIFCYDDTTWRQASALWGTVPMRVNYRDNPLDLLEAGIHEALRQKVVREGDTLVILMGYGSEAGSAIRVVQV